MHARGRPGQLSLKPLLHCDRTYFPQIRWGDLVKNRRKLLIIGIFIRNVPRKWNRKPEPSTCLNPSYKYSPGHSQRWQTQGLQGFEWNQTPKSVDALRMSFKPDAISFRSRFTRFTGFVIKRANWVRIFHVRYLFQRVPFNVGQTPIASQTLKQLTNSPVRANISSYDINIKIARPRSSPCRLPLSESTSLLTGRWASRRLCCVATRTPAYAHNRPVTSSQSIIAKRYSAISKFCATFDLKSRGAQSEWRRLSAKAIDLVS